MLYTVGLLITYFLYSSVYVNAKLLIYPCATTFPLRQLPCFPLSIHKLVSETCQSVSVLLNSSFVS